MAVMIGMTRREGFSQKRRAWRKDPVLFARDVLKFEPDNWQKDVLCDLANHNRVAVRSGQGVGKTGVEAVAFLWFLSCFRFARVVATAPTLHQLNDVLWAEVSKWQSESPLLRHILRWSKTRVSMKSQEERWYAVARTATKPENMQGFHEENMLFIVDEASGVADPIMEAIQGTLSGENNKLLLCGNPTKTSGTFHACFHEDRERYKCHKVSSRDSPRTNKDNIDFLIQKYGEDSNVVRVRVHGEFPLQEDDVLIPLTLIEESIRAGYDHKPEVKPKQIHIGCDVARFGDDFTVIGSKVDAKVEFHHRKRGQDTMQTVHQIVLLGEMLVARYKWREHIHVKVDDGGVGGGVVDRLREMKRDDPARFAWLNIRPVKFGTRIKNKHFHDSTSYMMNVVKDLLSSTDDEGNPKPIELLLPNDDKLVAQLSGRKYRLTETSKIQVESKNAMKKRNMPSPDEADCVLLLCLPMKEPRR